ncbi:MAG TPA: TolC family protein [Chroococcales cyanobacterium]|jgi:outer membrane protein TolC
MPCFRPLAATLALLFLSSPASAQEALKLPEVLQMARSHSHAVLSSRQRLLSFEAQKEAARALSLPSLFLQTGGGFTATNRPGNPGDGVDTSLALSQLLFDFDATRHAQGIAGSQSEIAKMTLLQSEQDAMEGAAVNYFQVLRSEALAGLSDDSFKQAQEHLRLGELRLKAGSGTRSEVLLLKARLANARVSLVQARNQVIFSRLALGNQINLPLGDRPLLQNTVLPPRSFDIDLVPALERRPEILAQSLKVLIGEERQEVEKSSSLPGLNATGRYNQRNLENGTLFAGLNLNWPLFDGNKSSSRLRSAQADTAAESEILEQLKQAAELDIHQEVQSSQEANSRFQAAQEGSLAATEAYRIALRRYALGLSTQLELIDVQNTLTLARDNAVQAQSDMAIAEIKLCRALGFDLAECLGKETGKRP